MHQLDNEEIGKIKSPFCIGRGEHSVTCLDPDGIALYSDIFWDLNLAKCLLLLQKVEFKLSPLEASAQGFQFPTGSLWGASWHWISASVSAPCFLSGMWLLIAIQMRLNVPAKTGGRHCSASRAATRCPVWPQEPRALQHSWQGEGNETNSMVLFLREICCCLCWLLRRLRKGFFFVLFCLFLFYFKISATIVCNHILNSLCTSSFSPSLVCPACQAAVTLCSHHC